MQRVAYIAVKSAPPQPHFKYALLNKSFNWSITANVLYYLHYF